MTEAPKKNNGMAVKSIIGLVVIAIAIGIVVSLFGSVSTYVTFAEAKQMNGKVHVSGSLKRDAVGEIVGMKYDALTNPNLFQFTLVDSLGGEEMVTYFEPKPTDIEKPGKIVVIGGYDKEQFIADKIILKCPSKYEAELTEGKK